MNFSTLHLASYFMVFFVIISCRAPEDSKKSNPHNCLMEDTIIEYFPNGNPSIITMTDKSGVFSKRTWFHESGGKKFSGMYKHGKEMGGQFFYDSTGIITSYQYIDKTGEFAFRCIYDKEKNVVRVIGCAACGVTVLSAIDDSITISIETAIPPDTKGYLKVRACEGSWKTMSVNSQHENRVDFIYPQSCDSVKIMHVLFQDNIPIDSCTIAYSIQAIKDAHNRALNPKQ